MKYRTMIVFKGGYTAIELFSKTKPRTETNIFVVNEGKKRKIYPLTNIIGIEIEEIQDNEEEKD